ncbi:MAG TPA: glycosyl transferase family protein [Allosphingosinicella sp.]
MDSLLSAISLVAGELALFAGAGFFLLGVNELAVDILWLIMVVKKKYSASTDAKPPHSDQIAAAEPPLAVFIPAWREAEVIGAMLRHTLKLAQYGSYRIYVGCYPNDPGTISAVKSVDNSRVRLVVGERPGGTTKADCLNTIWRSMVEDERREGRPFAAVILHDAEDVVHPDAFGWFGRLIGRYDMIQLPVVPLIDRGSRWLSGHYADEFSESHSRDLPVRQAIGAALPSAGVGCAFSRTRLEALVEEERGGPFDALSLTEDYELGLKLGQSGRALFLRVRDSAGKLVATGEFFPGQLDAALTQKSRWITGIALAGWDRLGWAGGLAERWMRLRDRQVLIVALVTAAGYLAVGLWLLLLTSQSKGADLFASPVLQGLAAANALLCLWRLGVRMACTANIYGWREGARAAPRLLVSTLILILASWRAIALYWQMRRSGSPRWNKTSHAFPAELSGA